MGTIVRTKQTASKLNKPVGKIYEMRQYLTEQGNEVQILLYFRSVNSRAMYPKVTAVIRDDNNNIISTGTTRGCGYDLEECAIRDAIGAVSNLNASYLSEKEIQNAISSVFLNNQEVRVQYTSFQ